MLDNDSQWDSRFITEIKTLSILKFDRKTRKRKYLLHKMSGNLFGDDKLFGTPSQNDNSFKQFQAGSPGDLDTQINNFQARRDNKGNIFFSPTMSPFNSQNNWAKECADFLRQKTDSASQYSFWGFPRRLWKREKLY